MAKIYVASSWRNAYQPAVVEKLREQGHEVYDFRNPPKKKGFAWSDIDPDWLNWSTDQYREALKHPMAKAGFESDFNAMQEADVCVLVLPCGRSANAEAGWMKGAGKKVYVLQKQHEEPELMYMMFDGVFGSEEEILSELAESEDEKIRKWIIHDIQQALDDSIYNGESVDEAKKAIAWLEKQGKQKPVEWSDADEAHLHSLITHLEQWIDRHPNTTGADIQGENVAWLKSLRPQKLSNVERNGKNWKPSEEQIEAVRIAAEIGSANNSWAMNKLKELLEQLKAL